MKKYAILIMALVGSSLSFAQTSEKTQVSSKEIGWKIQVVGLLGKPLGEKIQITGVSPSQPMKLSNPMEVVMLDGKSNDQKIQIEIQEPLKIETGYSYTIVGYESGAFGSSPTWVSMGGIQPPQSFQFRTFFIPVKVIEKKKL